MSSYEVFTDEQLNYGKVLVLEAGHGLTIEDIKRLTKAKNVRLIEPTDDYENIDNFLSAIVRKTLTTLHNYRSYKESTYHVEGDTAVTSLLALQTNKIRMAVVLDAASIKRLDDANTATHFIKSAKDAMERAVMTHVELSEILIELNLPDSITAKTPALDAVALGYADAELQHGMDTIAAVLKNKW